ncbi:MAG: cytochrome c peroxidase [Pirellulales bacterium]|jgi:cytochrome c peroxidase|nr:cytochrome c peroxidase [Thermoguttaceae bacterium]MDD4788285.1 cytochrome c peroxidase [Pirellulales bacterium]MDI9445715.1 cytochrome c peroxidase [Planctomycetota bacterium]
MSLCTVSFKARRGRTLSAGLIAGCLLGPLAAAAAPPEIPRGQHGEATAEYQLEELQKLMPQVDLAESPAGFDPVVWAAFIPEDNPLTPERVELGRKLFFDARLSDDGSVSCATCHDATRGFTDQIPVSEGIGGQFGKRNAPTVLNTALLQTLFWDGRSPTLDHQARLPILNPIEMGMPNEEAAIKAIRGIPEYEEGFKKAFGREMNYEDLGKAIGAFERTLVFVDSPFRRFLGGDPGAISPEAQAGWELFNGKARCMTCHPMNPSNPLGTDNRFHNVGVSARHQDFEGLAQQALKAIQEDASEQKLDELAIGTDMSELGRFMVTGNRADIGSFRTPLILNIGITGPYMHDGSLATLWDVIDHYNKGGEDNPFLDGGIEPLALSEEEIDQLVAFLFTLTDVRFADQNQRLFEAQRAAANEQRLFRDDAAAQRRTLPFEQRVMGAQGKPE